MHIYNITLVCDERTLPALIDHISEVMTPALTVRGLAARPRLARVISTPTGGEKEAESLSLQLEFDRMGDYMEWKKTILPPAMETLHSKFGEKVFSFCTLLKTIPLKNCPKKDFPMN